MSNDYKYSVEYACNGVKPDLPDDVLVEWVCASGGRGGISEVGKLVWSSVVGYHIAQFRIVDERYKPENWHKRGELPPVGTECEYTLDGASRWWKCEIRYVVADEGVVMFVPHLEIEQYCGRVRAKFRPLRTEREKFIDAARVIDISGVVDPTAFFGALFDAGFRAPHRDL